MFARLDTKRRSVISPRQLDEYAGMGGRRAVCDGIAGGSGEINADCSRRRIVKYGV